MKIAKNRFAFDLETIKSVRFLSLLLFALTLCLFLPSLQGSFLFYDESPYIYNNPHVKNGLSWGNVVWAFCSLDNSNWHPLTWLSHMLDVQIYGLNPWGHHLTNVLLHAFNTVLLFLVLRKMTGAMWCSLAVAVLFGIHPLRVESVASISERKDVLSVMFWLLAMWTYARFAEESKAKSGKSRWFYGLTFLFFVFGLMSKTMVVTFPCALLLLDFWPLQQWRWKAWKDLVVEKLPFLVPTLVISVVAYLAQKRGGMLSEMTHLSFGDRLGNAVISYCRYLGKFIWPENLCAFYPHPGHWPVVWVILAILFIFAFTAVAWLKRGQAPYLLVGWFWYLGTLVPVIGLVQLCSLSIADRYTYIPMIGIAVLVVWAIKDITSEWRDRTVYLSAAAGTVMIGLGAVTLHQLQFWKSDTTLFTRAIAVTESNYVAHTCFGVVLWGTPQREQSLAHFEEAVRLNPDYASAQKYLAADLMQHGRFDEAIVHLQKAIDLEPSSSGSEHDLGLAFAQKREWDNAAVHLRKAIELGADSAAAEHDLGYVLGQNNQWGESLKYFQKAAELDSTNANDQNDLGVAFLNCGRVDEGIASFEKALRLNPDVPYIRDNLERAKKLKEGGTNQPPPK